MIAPPNNHKWMVLSNTTLGMLAATINADRVPEPMPEGAELPAWVDDLRSCCNFAMAPPRG